MKFTETKKSLNSLKEYDKKVYVGLATKFVVRRAVSGIMVTLVHNYCPVETPAQKAQLYIGAWAVGGVVSDSASTWAADKVTDTIETVESLFKRASEINKETEEAIKEEPTAE